MIIDLDELVKSEKVDIAQTFCNIHQIHGTNE